MSKTLVVFGATGQQGGSVVDFVVNDPELSKEYNVRAVTRDITSQSAQALVAKGVEIVAANVDDEHTVRAALKGAHTVFAITVPDFKDIKGSETRQGRVMVDAAVSEGVKYYIFSTLPHVKEISGGKYTKVAGFDGKAEVEQYIRQQPIRSAFFAPGSFMQNYQQILKPRKMPDGTYSISRHVSPNTQLPMIETASDTGKFVGAILADPDNQQAAILSEATGENVVYKQLPEDVFKGFLPPVPYADVLIEMMLYQQDFGYYGPNTEELVAWAADNARGKLTTFEEYLERNPLDLD
ncbi:hypothetical protein LTR64_000675 [Lithohypha guttulata]|uniref:uncharacterized protein n=1 Tax=Lithohypha guttulata TaxID=1690604 RepID=UPI002DDED322|nr:hypothetical protein LTR51_005556 [Lithohypha guttulata]